MVSILPLISILSIHCSRFLGTFRKVSASTGITVLFIFHFYSSSSVFLLLFFLFSFSDSLLLRLQARSIHLFCSSFSFYGPLAQQSPVLLYVHYNYIELSDPLAPPSSRDFMRLILKVFWIVPFSGFYHLVKFVSFLHMFGYLAYLVQFVQIKVTLDSQDEYPLRKKST